MTDQPSLTQSIMTGLAGRCPRCHKGKLFSGFLNLRKQCPECGLDYSLADSGDGPALFVILISGFIVVGAALILVVTLLSLRLIKGLLIVLQYHHAAAEGRFERGPKR